MGAAELTSSCSGCSTSVPGVRSGRRLQSRGATHAAWIAIAYTALWITTLLGAVIAAAVPELAPADQPHPTLHGNLGDLASIAGTNARVLSAPFLLAWFRFPAHPRSRWLADLLITAILGVNALHVGLALGRWQLRLLPYVPQLPLEWLAAALAAAAWLNLRAGARRQTAAAYLAAVLVVVVAAAAVETIATPHARARSLKGQVNSATRALVSHGPASEWKAGGGLPALRSCAGVGTRFKVASLPSPRCRSVPLGRLASAAGLRQPPPDPAKEGPP
jgi:hypothetical protein